MKSIQPWQRRWRVPIASIVLITSVALITLIDLITSIMRNALAALMVRHMGEILAQPAIDLAGAEHPMRPLEGRPEIAALAMEVIAIGFAQQHRTPMIPDLRTDYANVPDRAG